MRRIVNWFAVVRTADLYRSTRVDIEEIAANYANAANNILAYFA